MSRTVKILQSSCCSSSQGIREDIESAAAEVGLEVCIDIINDLQEAMKYGTVNFPSLAIDGEVYAWNNVDGLEELKQLLKENNPQ